MSLTESNDTNELSSLRKRGKSGKSRIDFRPQPSQKALFEKAAALEGQTLTEFLIRSAEESARRVLERHEVLQLRGEAGVKFVEMLSNAPHPTDRLRAAFARHDKEVESR
jgi:uncharacterized protein (DUF1778 family)